MTTRARRFQDKGAQGDACAIGILSTFSPFRSIPFRYQNSTEGRFNTSAYTATLVDLLPSLIQHVTNSHLLLHDTLGASGNGGC